MDGKVNSASDFNENSYEKTKANQESIGIIQKFKNYIRRTFAVRVIGYSMSGIFEHGDIVGAKKVRRFTHYQLGDIIVFEKNGIKVIHMIVGTETVNGKTQYKTWGVNNPDADRGSVSKNDILGKVVMSTTEQYKILAQVEQGKVLVVDALGMVTLQERQNVIHEKLQNFINENQQFSTDKLKELICQVDEDLDRTTYVLKEIFNEIYNNIEGSLPESEIIHDNEKFQELITIIGDYFSNTGNYFWFKLDKKAQKKIGLEADTRKDKEEVDYFKESDQDLQNTNYDDWLNRKENIKNIQQRILKKQWGGKCAMTGERIGAQMMTRHHYRLGDINKGDCSISSLVPVLSYRHAFFTGAEPHTSLWTRRFEDAKFYIDKGIAYIPDWWAEPFKTEYEAYLIENEIIYIRGKPIN